jgi:hypothetical protein
VIQLSRGFDDPLAAEMLDELATAHLLAGDINLAAEARSILAERFPQDARAHSSLLWLVRLYASSEVTHARRKQSAGAAALQQQLLPQVAEKLGAAPASIDGASVTGGGASDRAAPDAQGDQQSMYALHLATQAMTQHAELAENPALVFQRAVAARRAGQLKASHALLSPLRHRSATDAWGQCARAEQWLAESRSDAAPMQVTPCLAAEDRPHLDGILDEAYWQSSATEGAPLKAAGIPERVTLRWAYDRQYLYFSILCSKQAGLAYDRQDGPRPRDADLAGQDHVRVLIDLDRDYASSYELLVDSRGWTADRCWHDAAWNPQWFVARGESSDGKAWTIEAAVPLAELTAHAPAAGQAWACSARRVLPSQRSATSEEGPADFSLLLFQP